MPKVRLYSFADRTAIDEPQPEVVDVNDLSAYKILVIESVAEMRTTMGMMLGQFGATQVEYAHRSGEALGQMRRFSYDIILCAFDLGTGFDGLYLFEEARRHGLLKASCVFIVLTGERQSTKVIGAAELAPDAIILKPFTGDTLYTRILRALRKKTRFKPIDDACIAHDFLRAIQLCNRAAAEGGEDAIEFVRMKVHLMLRVGDWKGTRDLTRELLGKVDFPWAKMALGKALYQLKEYDEAQHIFRQVIAEHELIMDAYDGLAKTQEAKHEIEAAKQTLQDACHRSPYVVARMRELGEVAVIAGDLALAEQSLTETVRLARFSFWPQISDYAALGEVQLQRGDVGAARKTADSIRKDFRTSNDRVLAEVLESNVALKLGDSAKARAILDLALHSAEQGIEPPSSTVGLALAQSCLSHNRLTEAEALTRAVLKNRHDDPKLSALVTRLYKKQGREDEALRLIEATAADIVTLNNEAVALAQSGNLKAAAERFLAAGKEMPNNLQMLLNTVNALLALVNQEGWHETYMQHASDLLNRINTLDPTSGRGLQMAEIYRKTKRRYGMS
nr:response regulator [uncultured Deefgea sp.]